MFPLVLCSGFLWFPWVCNLTSHGKVCKIPAKRRNGAVEEENPAAQQTLTQDLENLIGEGVDMVMFQGEPQGEDVD